MTDRLRKAELEFEFFEAVDGKQLSPHLLEYVDPEHSEARRKYGTPLTPGEVGCALSHALIYRKMIDEQIPNAFVLEDDVTLSPELVRLIRGGDFTSLDGVGLVSLVYPPLYAWRGPSKTLAGGTRLYRPMELASTTACYYLTSDVAARLWREAIPISDVADWPFPIHQWKTMFCAYPRLASTNDEPEGSLIEDERALLIKARLEFQQPYKELFFTKWPFAPRVAARLLTLTLLPSVLWPEKFGTTAETKRFIRAAARNIKFRVLGRLLI